MSAVEWKSLSRKHLFDRIRAILSYQFNQKFAQVFLAPFQDMKIKFSRRTGKIKYLFLKSEKNRGKDQSVKSGRDLTGEDARVFGMLEPYPVHIDELSRKLNMAVSQLSAILVNLEVKGLVARSPGMYFSTYGDGL